MTDLVGVSVGVGFGILGGVGVICVNMVIRMFKGDIMGQLFKFVVTGFVIIMVVGFSDAVVLMTGRAVPSGILSAALMVSFALLLIGLVRLIQWNDRANRAATVGAD